MGIVDKLEGITKRIFKTKNNDEFLKELLEKEQTDNVNNSSQTGTNIQEPYEPLNLPEGELVSFSDEVLDTNSRASIEKLKHNLEILIKQAKEKGKIDKFILIREDDFFPADWEWRVLSKNTNLELEPTSLSFELRKAYALEQNGIKPYTEIGGMKVPNFSYDRYSELLSKVDKTLGCPLLPSRFRSTKHFTVNTPLGITGNYNTVSTDRDYIIMDNIDNFLQSGYAYSVAYHDAYLDVSHESLPISQDTVVLINDEKYDRIMQDEKTASQLAQRRVVRFKGDELVAINMVLSEMGALPSTIGSRYAEYDKELYDILDNSIKALAEEHNLLFDKSHAGELKPTGGHFSNYYDDRNTDYEEAFRKFVSFLGEKFPENKDLFPGSIRFNENNSQKIVDTLGTEALLEAIGEYNELAAAKGKETLEEYKKDRQSITPEIHEKFVSTIGLINNFYKADTNYENYNLRQQTEEAIRSFLQSGTVKEQLQAAESVWELLPNKFASKSEVEVKQDAINMRNIVSNAITKGVATEHVAMGKNVENRELQAQIDEEVKDGK